MPQTDCEFRFLPSLKRLQEVIMSFLAEYFIFFFIASPLPAPPAAVLIKPCPIRVSTLRISHLSVLHNVAFLFIPCIFSRFHSTSSVSAVPSFTLLTLTPRCTKSCGISRIFCERGGVRFEKLVSSVRSES